MNLTFKAHVFIVKIKNFYNETMSLCHIARKTEDNN